MVSYQGLLTSRRHHNIYSTVFNQSINVEKNPHHDQKKFVLCLVNTTYFPPHEHTFPSSYILDSCVKSASFCFAQIRGFPHRPLKPFPKTEEVWPQDERKEGRKGKGTIIHQCTISGWPKCWAGQKERQRKHIKFWPKERIGYYTAQNSTTIFKEIIILYTTKVTKPC